MLIKADILCFNTERLCDLSLTFDFEAHFMTGDKRKVVGNGMSRLTSS